MKLVAATVVLSLAASGVMYLMMGKARADARLATQARQQAEANLDQALGANVALNANLMSLKEQLLARDAELSKNRRVHRRLTQNYSNLEKELRDVFETINDGCSIRRVPDDVIRLHESRAKGDSEDADRDGVPKPGPAGSQRDPGPPRADLRGLRLLGVPVGGSPDEVPRG